MIWEERTTEKYNSKKFPFSFIDKNFEKSKTIQLNIYDNNCIVGKTGLPYWSVTISIIYQYGK